MKYLVLIVTTFFLLSLNLAYAQTQPGYRLEFGLNGGTTTSSIHRKTLGLDFRLEKDFSSRLSGTLTAGGNFLFNKSLKNVSIQDLNYSTNEFAVKAGLKFFLSDRIYIAGEAGRGFSITRGTNSFVYSPSVGYRFRNGLDLSLKYDEFTKKRVANILALRLAYGINLDKRYARKLTEQNDGWEMSIAIASGTTTGLSNPVLGGEVNLYRPLTSNLEATASAGVYHIFNEDSHYDSENILRTSGRTAVPVMAGLRVFAGEKFHIGSEAGMAFGPQGSQTFAWATAAGLAYRNGLDLSLKYNGFKGYQVPDFLALKLGYHFKL